MARGPKQNLVYVDIIWLAHREGNGPCERVGRNGKVLIELVEALGDIRLGDAVRQFGRDRTRRDHRCPDVVGLYFLTQPFGERQHRMLSRCIDCAASTDLMAGHRGNIDNVSSFLPLHVRQRRGNAVEHAFDVDVYHPVPVVDLQTIERRLRH